jgi:hypothetical protein
MPTLSVPVRCTISGCDRISSFGGRFATAAAPPEAGRDHRHAQVVAHLVVDHGADDHHRVLGGELLDRVHHLVVLLERQARGRGDVDQHAARARRG